MSISFSPPLKSKGPWLGMTCMHEPWGLWLLHKRKQIELQDLFSEKPH
jgi:hypothetical protein